jgi:hypothetical protein
LIAEGKRGIQGRVLKVPHQGRGVEESYGSDAQTGLGTNTHAQIDYQHRAQDAGSSWG